MATPVLKTVATDGTGVAELWKRVARAREYLEQNGLVEERRRDRVRDELRAIVANSCASKRPRWVPVRDSTALVEQVAARTTDPFTAAAELLG